MIDIDVGDKTVWPFVTNITVSLICWYQHWYRFKMMCTSCSECLIRHEKVFSNFHKKIQFFSKITVTLYARIKKWSFRASRVWFESDCIFKKMILFLEDLIGSAIMQILPRRNAKCHNKFIKFNCSIFIFVKNVENETCKECWVALWEKLSFIASIN